MKIVGDIFPRIMINEGPLIRMHDGYEVREFSYSSAYVFIIEIIIN